MSNVKFSHSGEYEQYGFTGFDAAYRGKNLLTNVSEATTVSLLDPENKDNRLIGNGQISTGLQVFTSKGAAAVAACYTGIPSYNYTLSHWPRCPSTAPNVAELFVYQLDLRHCCQSTVRAGVQTSPQLHWMTRSKVDRAQRLNCPTSSWNRRMSVNATNKSYCKLKFYVCNHPSYQYPFAFRYT